MDMLLAAPVCGLLSLFAFVFLHGLLSRVFPVFWSLPVFVRVLFSLLAASSLFAPSSREGLQCLLICVTTDMTRDFLSMWRVTNVVQHKAPPSSLALPRILSGSIHCGHTVNRLVHSHPFFVH